MKFAGRYSDMILVLNFAHFEPVNVIHYVSEHQYQPPPEFIAAVLDQRALRPL